MRICIPTHLSDPELIAEVARLARVQRDATARLIAHLVELDARSLHLAAGFPSLFAYCCEVLHLSEGETSNRIMAARVARRFPRPDIAASIRKVPARTPTVEASAETPVTTPPEAGAPLPSPTPGAIQAMPTVPLRRAVVAPLAPDRYEIRFTASAETRAKLRRAQEQRGCSTARCGT